MMMMMMMMITMMKTGKNKRRKEEKEAEIRAGTRGIWRNLQKEMMMVKGNNMEESKAAATIGSTNEHAQRGVSHAFFSCS